MKKKYESPTIDIVELSVTPLLSASGFEDDTITGGVFDGFADPSEAL